MQFSLNQHKPILPAFVKPKRIQLFPQKCPSAGNYPHICNLVLNNFWCRSSQYINHKDNGNNYTNKHKFPKSNRSQNKNKTIKGNFCKVFFRSCLKNAFRRFPGNYCLCFHCRLVLSIQFLLGKDAAYVVVNMQF